MTDSRRIAVVCHRNQDSGVKRLWPDAVIVYPMQATMGQRFDQIIMLWSPTNQPRHLSREECETLVKTGSDWYDNGLLCCLKPGGEVVWLV